MAVTIYWEEPTEAAVTLVEISRATTKNGSYSVLTAVYAATSDGNVKSSSNTWVTFYFDSSGNSTHWYKIRFWNSTNSVWSVFSDAISSVDETLLCTIEQVKEELDTVGRWDDNEIYETIKIAGRRLYRDLGTPIQSSFSPIGKIDNDVQIRYYVGERDIYRVDRVFYGTSSKTELFLNDGYRVNPVEGMVEILPFASSGIATTADAVDNDIEIEYVPGLVNEMAVLITQKILLGNSDTSSGGETSKELEIVMKRFADVEQDWRYRVAFAITGDFTNYDPVYGVNKQKVKQNFRRNRDIGEFGW